MDWDVPSSSWSCRGKPGLRRLCQPQHHFEKHKLPSEPGFQCLTPARCNSPLAALVLPWWHHLGWLFWGQDGLWDQVCLLQCPSPASSALPAAVKGFPFSHTDHSIPVACGHCDPRECRAGQEQEDPKAKQRGGTAKWKCSLHRGAAHQKLGCVFPTRTTRPLSMIQIYPAALIEANNDPSVL